jgi:single-strand DNA-binding protein
MNHVTVVGNLTRDPELRYTNASKPVVSFTVAETARRKDGDQWVDGDTSYYDCTAWDSLAENIAENLSKGTRVIVTGRLQQRSWETPDGKRSKVELRIEACGPDLKWVKDRAATPQVDPMEDPF